VVKDVVAWQRLMNRETRTQVKSEDYSNAEFLVISRIIEMGGYLIKY